MNPSGRIFHNLLSVSFMRFASAGLSFVLFWLIARKLGTATLGGYTLVMSLFVLLQQLPLLGLHLKVIRDVAADPQDTAHLLANATLLASLVGVLLALGLGISGMQFYQGEVSAAILFAAVALVPTGWINAMEAVVMGQQRMRLYAGVNLLEIVLRVASGVAVVLLDGGLVALFVSFFLCRLLAAWAYLIAGGYWRALKWREMRFADALALLHQMPVFFWIMLCSAAINRFDFLFLSRMGSLSDVGMYATGYKIYEVAMMVPSMLTVVLYPMFSNLYANQRAEFHVVFARTFRYVFMAGMPLAMGVAWLATDIVAAIFGAAYLQSGMVLQILIFATVLVGLDQLLTMVLLVSDAQGRDLQVLLAALAAYIVLLLLCIPRWGFFGAAAATTASILIQMLIRLWFTRTTVAVGLALKSLIRPFLAALLMLATCMLAASWPPVLVVLVGMTVYLLALLGLGEISLSEIGNFQHMLLARNRRAG